MFFNLPFLQQSFLVVICTLLPGEENRYTLNNQKKPNIVLINIDDLGYKDLGYMGSAYYETPHIDQLSKEGMFFSRAYSGASNCAPSRACLLSGLNTPKHGVYTVSPSERGHSKTRKLVPVKNKDHLNDSVFTLPKMLSSAGYVTGSIGKWHIGENPKTQGIQFNIGGSGRGNPGKDGYFSPYNIDFIADGPNGEYLTDRLTDEALKYIEKFKDTTFFLYLPYYTVHTPIMGKQNLIEKFKDKAPARSQNRADYAAMIYSMDQNVGRVLNKLKEVGLEENTIVIFTSDNGGIRAISEQSPLRAGKGSYYEGGIRVPLIIKWPMKIRANTISEQIVSNLDFYPTLQSIVDPPMKAFQLDGINIEKVLYENATIERKLFFHFPIYLQKYDAEKDQGRDPLFRTRPGSVIISGDWKLHEYFEDGGIELYNLKNDIGETHNLANLEPLITQQMRKDLKSWRNQNNAPVPTKSNAIFDPNYYH